MNTGLGIHEQLQSSNGNGAVVNLPYVYDLRFTYLETTKIQIDSGYCMDSTLTTNLRLSSATECNLAVNGVNGLDTGSVAADTWYYIFIIFNPTTNTTNTLASTSRTTPTLPEGYSIFRWIGSIKTYSTAQILPFQQCGWETRREVRYIADSADLIVLFGGTGTGWTDVDCSLFIPPHTQAGRFLLEHTGGTDFGLFRPDGTSVDFLLTCRNNDTIWACMPTSGEQKIEYRNSSVPSAQNWVTMLGFIELLFI